MEKPFSPSCERNSEPIFGGLSDFIPFDVYSTLFEIGSGTGQHAAYFSERFPKLTWLTSDNLSAHEGIRLWTREMPNVTPPIEYLAGEKGSLPACDFYFTANTLHIMSWANCLSLLNDLAGVMKNQSYFFAYGPFNLNGQFTSDSNRKFDAWLKERDSLSGIRNFEDIELNLADNDIYLKKKLTMPANNFFLAFRKEINRDSI